MAKRENFSDNDSFDLCFAAIFLFSPWFK